LFYRLTAHRQPVTRDQLCFLFWPDSPNHEARRNLTRLLTHLRHALQVAVPGAGSWLILCEDSVALDTEHIWADTAALEMAVHNPELLEDCIEQVHGPFLQGFTLAGCPEYNLWVESEQRWLVRIVLEQMAALVETHSREGHLARAIFYANRYLEQDNLSEEMHRKLIELYAASGDRSAAMRQYDECAGILEKELGVSPLPETQAACRAAMSEHFSRGGPYSLPEASGLPLHPDLPLIGREDVLGKLQRLLENAKNGQGQVALITGEAGIGKTRLLDEFTDGLSGQAMLLRQAGTLAARGLALHLVTAALRQAIVQSTETLANLEPAWLADAALILPELRQWSPGVTPIPLPESAEARTRLFDALLQLTLALAAGPHPLILCFDDLHWADASSLEWLACLGGRLSDCKILLLLAAQSEELDAVQSLRRALAQGGKLVEIALSGLPAADLHQFVAGLPGMRMASPTLIDRIQHTTGGNPFFLRETLNVLRERLAREPGMLQGGELPLPASIRSVVRLRLERLSPQERQVLEALAVLNAPASFDVLLQTAGRSELETCEALDALMARKMVSDEKGIFSFRHPCIQEVVYDDVSVWRKRLLHRRAGEALQVIPGDHSPTLAGHFELAEQYGKAAQYALQAGAQMLDIFSSAEALRFLDQALRLLRREAVSLHTKTEEVANRRLQIQVLDKRCRAYRLAGDMRGYLQDLEEQDRLAEWMGDPRTLAYLRLNQTNAHRWFCRYAEAQTCAEEALRLSQSAEDVLLQARAQRELGLIARSRGDFDEAETHLLQALALFEQIKNPINLIHALGNLSTLYFYLDQPQRAAQLAEQALALCEQSDLPFHKRLPLGDLGAAAVGGGDPAQAQRWLEESLEIACRVGDRTQEIFCLYHLGRLDIRQKRLIQAGKRLQTALALAESLDSRSELSRLHLALAEACHLHGNSEGALAHARQALHLAETYGRRHDQRCAQKFLDRFKSD
jgi:DNA-binding SARP family transcriptional activator/Flp pilus assembly protein TadD